MPCHLSIYDNHLDVKQKKVNKITILPFCRVGRISPVVKTAVPVDGRFEHMVLSCHVLSDHSIALMEREFSNALDVSPLLIINLWLFFLFIIFCRSLKNGEINGT